MTSSIQSRLGTAPEEGCKAPVKTVANNPITLSGEQTINTVAVVAGDRVLVNGQVDSSENGIYTVSTTAWTYAKDWNKANDVIAGMLVPSSETIEIYQLKAYTGTFVAGTTEVEFQTGAVVSRKFEHQTGAEASGTTFTLQNMTYTPNVNDLEVEHNGQTLITGQDYVELTSTTVQILQAFTSLSDFVFKSNQTVSLTTTTTASVSHTVDGVSQNLGVYLGKPVKNFATLAAAVADTGFVVGDAVNLAERTTGNGGGGMWDVVLASAVTPNTYNIVQCTGVPTLALNIRTDNVMYSKQVGIIGDGSTDFTTAINSMLTVISSAGGGEFVIQKSSGSYNVNAATGIKPNGNTKLTIEKNAIVEAITNALSNYSVIQVSNADNVTISGGGTIKGERTTHTGGTGEGGMCIRMDNSTNVTIEDLEITEGWGDGIYVGGVGGQCSNITIRKNRIHNNRRNNISVVDGAKGVITENLIYNANGTNPEAGIDLEAGYQENVTDWTVSNNVVSANAGGGIAAVTPWGPLISTVRNIAITGNTLISNGSSVTDGYGIAAARMLNCSITGNTIKDTDGRGLVIGSGGHKIDLVPNSVAAITSGINATGNNITGSTSHGIFLDAAQSLADLSNILVSGNTSNNNAGGGIYCSKTSGQTCQDITVSGNTTKNNTLSGVYFNRANDININGNTIIGNTKDGIEIDGSAGDTFGYLIASNLVKGNTESGIQSWYANKSTITGNKIIGNGEEGIYSFDGHDSTITANEISGNSQTTDDTYNGIWLNRSDDCVVSGNLIRHDGGTNQQKYGIEIEATAERNLVTGNNVVNSGRTASILDSSGTSTVNNNLS